MGIFTPNITPTSTDSGELKNDFNDIKGLIPKVNLPSTTTTTGGNINYTPGGKGKLKGSKLTKQIKQDLGYGKAKKTKKGGAKIGGFGSAAEAEAAGRDIISRGSQGGSGFDQADYQVVRGPKGFQVKIKPKTTDRNVDFSAPTQYDSEGNPMQSATDSSVETTNLANEQIRNIIRELIPGIVEGEKTRTETFGQAQEGLQRELGGVGEFSTEQEAEVQRTLDAARARGNDQLLNDFGGGVRDVRNSLQNSGFASSNLADINLQAGPEKQYRQGTIELGRELGLLEQDVRSNIATRQNEGVNTLNSIENAKAPELPGTQQLQDGTFQKLPSLAEITSLARLYNLDIPAKDQQAFLDLITSLIGSQENIASPGIGSQLIGALGGPAGTAVGGLLTGGFK